MSTTGPLVFPLPGNHAMAQELARTSGASVGELSIRSFPDTETYVRLETDPRNRDVAFVCTLPEPNVKVLPLLFAAGTARSMGARSIGLVAPYLAYMRQDAQFRSGEAVTAKIFAGLLATEAHWLVTIDPHLHRIASLSEIFGIPATALHVANEIGRWVFEHVRDPLIIGPDRESVQWAGAVAAAAGAPCVLLEKERLSETDVIISMPDVGTHDGRTPVIVDDIISTGHTMIAALGQVRRRLSAAHRAVCIGVHALFSTQALDAMFAAGAGRVVTTNTIPHFSNGIDVTMTLAAALRRQWAAPGVPAPNGEAPSSVPT